MKRSTCFCLVVALIVFSLKSLSQSTVLWRVTRDGISQPSYLLGTYHQLGSSFIDSFPIIREKLQQTEIAIFETTIDEKGVIDYYNAREKNEKLKQLLPEEDYQYVSELCRNARFDFNKFSIGELDLTLKFMLQSSQYCLDRYKDSVYIDMYLYTLAGETGKKLVMLETNNTQFDAISKYASQYKDKFYTRSIHQNIKRLKAKKPLPADCKMINEYINFKLNYHFNQECPIAVLSSARNQAWQKEILANLEKGNVFVTVGLFHLYYKCGIIRMLQENGFTVEPVPLK